MNQVRFQERTCICHKWCREIYLHEHKEYKLVVQTKGYDSWTGREPILLITRAMVGRLTNTSHAAFRYQVGGVVNYLASNVIRAIPGRQHTTKQLLNESWQIQPVRRSTEVRRPTEVTLRNRMDGSVSCRFHGYGNITTSEPTFNDDDVEEVAGVT